MPSGNRSRRGKRERGRDSHSDAPNHIKAGQASGDKRTPTTTDNKPALKLATNMHHANEEEEVATTICWICAEPIKYYSLPACNHRTCHVCALRLRALYEKVECTFCKEPQSTVIFAAFHDADFSSYKLNAIPHKDSKLGIFFETADMMEETLALLRFNCPDVECGYTASGWPDLKLHARIMHKKVFCDLCIQNKKVFPHEHALYLPNALPLHLPSMLPRPRQQSHNETIEGGNHPLCAFCNECFFGEDELFVHMREQHEECFLCKRNEVRYQYFQNYNNLEQHFSEAHFACADSACQAQKFVVFDSELDLNAHRLEVHSAEMSPKERREARRVQLESSLETGNDSWRGVQISADRERGRESTIQNHSGVPGISRRGVEGLLMLDDTQATRCVAPSGRAASTRSLTSESNAHDLISTVWNLLDQNMQDTAKIINAVVGFLGEDEKKYDLLAVWSEYGIDSEQRHQSYDLCPTDTTSHYADTMSRRVTSTAHATAPRSSQGLRDHHVALPASPSSPSSFVVLSSNAPTFVSSSTSQLGDFPSLVRPRANSKASPECHRKSKSWASVAAMSSLPSPATTPKRADKPRQPPTLSAIEDQPSPPAAGPSFDANVTPTHCSPRSPHTWASLASTDLSAWTPIWNTGGGGTAISETTVGEGKKGKGKQKQRHASASFSL